MAKMKAVQVPKAGADFEIVERDIPQPDAGQARIHVQACGICHSDVITKEGLFPGITYPRVPSVSVFCVTSAKKMQPLVLLSITYCAGERMSVKSVQFTVAAHIMAALGYFHGEEISSATLADSVNADPTFVRKSLSKLSKAGLRVLPDRSRCWIYTVRVRHHRRLRFIRIQWTRDVRSVATSRSACRGFFLK